MDKDTGGPAFPTETFQAEGMTLRDYFAAKAMPMVAAQIYAMRQSVHGTTATALAAKMAYEYADEMLKARNQ